MRRVKFCLPPAAGEVERVVGAECVVRLMEAFPPIRKKGKRVSGRYIYIPKRKGGSVYARRLEDVVGAECMDKLVRMFGGDRIYVSNCREFLINYRIECIGELRRLGVSAKFVAGMFGVTERYVYRLTEGYGREGR